MKNYIEKIIRNDSALGNKLTEEQRLKRQVSALFGILTDIYGPDRLVLKAGKLEALDGMRSGRLEDQILALQKIVYEDPTLDNRPTLKEIPKVLDEVEDEIADLIARKSVEDEIEKKIAEKMQQKHEEYVQEIRSQVLKENKGPENGQTLKKLALLEKLEQVKLSRSAVEILRPKSMEEIVGQDRAIRSLLAKIASPYPQHVILYGPPGVGKTTAARLVLEQAKQMKHTPFGQEAPFVEVDGSTLRWDPREVTNPLLGSVHDPIYQGARRDLAEGGIPEPKLGLVTEAHGGVLFIDEIGELDPMLQNKLLKVLEDKRVAFDSSYYDPHDENIPKYIKKLFSEGAPADFVLIGATTRDPSEISPALRSRCAEIYFEPLTPADITRIVEDAARKLEATLEGEVTDLICEYTIEGRKAVGILADAYGLALYRAGTSNPKGEKERLGPRITCQDILEVVQTSRLVPHPVKKASSQPAVGKVFALGVYGYLGSVLEVEAVVFPARDQGRGRVRFNETAGSMAKDSAFNASSVVRRLLAVELSDYDVHVNVIGGGNIDGPSAGAAITVAIISALKKQPVRQDVAVTGEISVQGKVKGVGGIYEKLYGAKQASMKMVIIPKENEKDIPEMKGVTVVTADDIQDVLDLILVPRAEEEARAG